ncbi:DUF2330 domain-containing protein [bacterium]|nr:DUF2330 domain-containing protein [bacterium]
MKYLQKYTYHIASILFVFLFFGSLFGDGGFFYNVETIGNSAESPNQRALVIYDGSKETLILQVKYSGTVDDFAWIVPVPHQPEADGITTTSDSIFQILHYYTQPRVVFGGDGNEGWWMPGERGVFNDSMVFEQGVTVWEMLQVGPYEVAVLSGTSSQALIEWLNANGYSYTDDAEPVIDYYIKKEWFFVALKVNVQDILSKSNSTYQSGLPALKIAFLSDQPVFPLRISEISAAPENEIELYVAAPHRMVSDSYQTITMDQEKVEEKIESQIAESEPGSVSGIACFFSRILDPAEPSLPEYDYEAIFRDEVNAHGEPTFVVEYAGDAYTIHDPVSYPRSGSFIGIFNAYFPPATVFWVTRFRTILSSDDMQDDVTFIPDPDGDNNFSIMVFPEPEHWNPWSASILIWPGFFLIPFAAFKRIRHNYWREWMIGVLLLLMI